MQIIVVQNPEKGIQKAKEILYEKVDKKTFFILAGGQTPSPLYKVLAQEKIIHPGAVGIIDERYGKPFHENSNELMIKNSGLLDYLSKKNIPFYPMLQKGKTLEESALLYDEIIRKMFFTFPRSVLLLGLGEDGHIASIFPNRKDFTNPLVENDKEYQYVADVVDEKKYGKRITLTFAGLSLVDQFVVFAFGKKKKKAIQRMFEHGSLGEIPARFLNQEMGRNTLIITDQKV